MRFKKKLFKKSKLASGLASINNLSLFTNYSNNLLSFALANKSKLNTVKNFETYNEISES